MFKSFVINVKQYLYNSVIYYIDLNKKIIVMKKLSGNVLLSALLMFTITMGFTQVKQISYDNDIIDIAISSDDHTTLVAAVQAAGLVEVLKSEGPFTVFAPTNAAFAKLPQGTVSTLLQPENKDKLAGLLTYHVVKGNLNAAAVIKAINDGGGSIDVETVNGGKITVKLWEGKVVIKDAQGNKATVVATDLKGSNGVIHVIDTVIMPK